MLNIPQPVHIGPADPGPSVVYTPPSAMPYRRAQSVCGDEQFVALLNAYRASGGLAPAEQLLLNFKDRGGPDVSTLARWIVARQVVNFTWQARTWLPLFQIDPVDLTPRRELAEVLAEVNAVHDETQVAQWFVQPHRLLDGRTPVQALCVRDIDGLLRAAKVDRFVAEA